MEIRNECKRRSDKEHVARGLAAGHLESGSFDDWADASTPRASFQKTRLVRTRSAFARTYVHTYVRIYTYIRTRVYLQLDTWRICIGMHVRAAAGASGASIKPWNYFVGLYILVRNLECTNTSNHKGTRTNDSPRAPSIARPRSASVLIRGWTNE